MEVDLDELRQRWVGHDFDVAEFQVDTRRMLEWAESCGEEEPRFTDPEHPDFQAHPTFTAQFVSRKMFPEDFPLIQKGFFMIDGGKSVTCLAPIRPADRLTARSRIADIYEKTGRSGNMIFVVHRMSFENQHGVPVSVVDWKLIQKPGGRA